MRRLIFTAIMACGLTAAMLPGQAGQAAALLPPADEYAFAEKALMGGETEAGLKALERAADQNNLRAQVRLAHIYREGKLVAQDEFKACRLYSEAASGHSRLDPKHPLAEIVGEAYRYWAKCYVKGLSQQGWTRNLNAAAELYFHAGVIFGDVPGLYELALLYLTGQGVNQNTKLGVDHLYMTSRKRYPPALARLGHLMWEGKVMKRRASAGLALLILAREGCAAEDRAWISSFYDDAVITATPEEEREAVKFAAEWRAAYGTVHNPTLQEKAANMPGAIAGQRAPARDEAPAAGERQHSSFGTLATGVSSLPDQQ